MAALLDLRTRRGLTQKELAERTGLRVRTIRQLERGDAPRPKPTTVAKIAAALDVDALALWGRASDPSSTPSSHRSQDG
jgi:transcriptional regulator with XRE-family HTH domain